MFSQIWRSDYVYYVFFGSLKPTLTSSCQSFVIENLYLVVSLCFLLQITVYATSLPISTSYYLLVIYLLFQQDINKINYS